MGITKMKSIKFILALTLVAFAVASSNTSSDPEPGTFDKGFVFNSHEISGKAKLEKPFIKSKEFVANKSNNMYLELTKATAKDGEPNYAVKKGDKTYQIPCHVFGNSFQSKGSTWSNKIITSTIKGPGDKKYKDTKFVFAYKRLGVYIKEDDRNKIKDAMAQCATNSRNALNAQRKNVNSSFDACVINYKALQNAKKAGFDSQKEIDRITQEMEKLNKEYTKESEKATAAYKEMDKAKKSANAAKSKTKSAEKDVKKLQADYAALEQQLNAMNSKDYNQDKAVKDAQAKIDAANKEP